MQWQLAIILFSNGWVAHWMHLITRSPALRVLKPDPVGRQVNKCQILAMGLRRVLTLARHFGVISRHDWHWNLRFKEINRVVYTRRDIAGRHNNLLPEMAPASILSRQLGDITQNFITKPLEARGPDWGSLTRGRWYRQGKSLQHLFMLWRLRISVNIDIVPYNISHWKGQMFLIITWYDGFLPPVRCISAPSTTLFGPVVCLHCFNFVNTPPPKSPWN